jgi:cytochrome c oxidase assembly protein subunit 15
LGESLALDPSLSTGRPPVHPGLGPLPETNLGTFCLPHASGRPTGGWEQWGILLVLTITRGGLVAGTKAGLLYTSFPLMGGSFFPSEGWDLVPGWCNLFDNPATVQWIHRTLALVTTGCCMGVSLLFPRLWPLGATAFAQATLGVFTLLGQVPLWTAAFHQIGAFILLGVLLWGRRKYG